MLRHAPHAAIGLLPVFALLLAIAYAGSAGRHPLRPRRYAAHLVFGAHNHAFLFPAASLIVLIDFWPARMTLLMWMITYALASMKAVYGRASCCGALLIGLLMPCSSRWPLSA